MEDHAEDEKLTRMKLKMLSRLQDSSRGGVKKILLPEKRIEE